MIISCAALLVGAIAPWATVEFLGEKLTVGGLDGDGSIVLVLALLASAFTVVLLLSSKRPRPGWTIIICIILAVLCAAIGLYDWGSLENVVGNTELTDLEENLVDQIASTGWGLMLTTIASLSLLVASITALVVRRGEAPPPAAAAPPAPEA
jgi:hypothetical protein